MVKMMHIVVKKGKLQGVKLMVGQVMSYHHLDLVNSIISSNVDGNPTIKVMITAWPGNFLGFWKTFNFF
jgi:hypothetical protein